MLDSLPTAYKPPGGLHPATPRDREELLALRDQAGQDQDLPAALQLDDLLEDHAVITGDDRVTCFTCQGWADHWHNPFTGAREDSGGAPIATTRRKTTR